MKVSVIVPVHNDLRNLALCLQSIYDCDEQDFEIVVVDDGSAEDVKSVADEFPCQYLRLPVNRGQAYARNWGVKNCIGDIVLFTDSDCRVMRNWVKIFSGILVDAHFRVSGVVAVTGCLRSANGFVEMSHAYAGYAYVMGGLRRVMEYLNTSCVAVYKDAFEEVGGFSEDMRNGEDPDLALKFVEAGKQVVFDPSVWVIHEHGIHAFQDMCLKHKQWGNALGLSLIERHSKRFRLLLWISSQPVIHFLSIVPLALATTIKICAFNFRSDKKIWVYSPGILVSKIFFRWGIFIKSLKRGA